ncbi:DUF4190 domain-containing protein [Nocardioides antri]|uniref:Septum formation-related domain-containing protein n=1 Tax=Nocardioides antri TaxID=2607659 RepID=A0A5B1M1P1_9ACTN|nr:DUF4190 domain-containing protein [Nocardioides antri]KAA1425660.1 hypothetical protein F0U47_17910 [Nocardioides antri]
MSDKPPEGLTPPGPGMDPTPESSQGRATPRSGGMSLEDWLATQQAVGRPPTTTRMPAPVERFNASTSRKMAGWALTLSLLFCIPFAFLVAIGLAIAVLVRAADGGDHGRGRAIAALVISGLLVIANIAYVVVVVVNGVDTTERDEDGRVTEAGTVTLDKLRVGDCFNEPRLDDIPTDGSDGEASATVTVVPCAQEHQAEVYHIITLESDDYPGQKALDRRSLDCYTAFKDYVGIAYRRSKLDFVMHFPSKMTWRFGDRTILCSLARPDAGKFTGSLRGSRE